MNEDKGQTETRFKGWLTDGTEVEFITRNFYEQFNNVYYDGIFYIKLILR
jgi:hypothetical protein